MKKILFFFIFVQFSLLSYAQYEIEVLDSVPAIKDTTNYVKSLDYTLLRKFDENFKERYADDDFIYKEEKEEKPKKSSSPTDFSFLKGIFSFLQTIFPFLLGGFVIFLILKLVLGAELGLFNFNKGKKKVAEKLIYEEDDIHDVDLESLLKKAIAAENYRLAIRYAYLIVLKELSTYKLIDYHKDKTNTEYKFELEKGKIREDFSYLAYVYTYVWYGEFPISKEEFAKVQTKFSSFKTNLK
ncbi:hypothetical protein [uncultured Polaribacter sp.]|uniref:hypothetical protein n=1 Tax=uncultured Polaribacter sp. TaxID=174711 RepID=UPI002630C86F|nr:hypothetical protein [uncultured Polaribacter sp.]